MRTMKSFVTGVVLVICLSCLNGCAPLLLGAPIVPSYEHATIQDSEVRADSTDRRLSMEEARSRMDLEREREYRACLEEWLDANYCQAYLLPGSGWGMGYTGYTFGYAPSVRQAAEMQMLRIHVAEGEQTDWRQNQAISAILARIAAGEAVDAQMRSDLEGLGVRVEVVEGEAARALIEAGRAQKSADKAGHGVTSLGSELGRTQEIVILDGEAQDNELVTLKERLKAIVGDDE